MVNFTDIEKEYFDIEPYDNIRLDKFYNKHYDFFNQPDYPDNDTNIKVLEILIEIACSYSFAEKHKEALLLIAKIKPRLRSDIIQSLGDITNQLFLCAGQSNLALKNYRQALINLKEYKPTNKQKESNDALIQFCKDKLIGKSLLIIAIPSLTIIIVKYTTKWFFTDLYLPVFGMLSLFGGFGLLAIGLYGILKRRKQSQNTDNLNSEK